MALIRRAAGSGTTIAVLTFGLMANLAPMATFAAVMPEITEDWGLTASQAGWIGGIYFGGYAACVPILAGATDKIDARWVFVGCSLLGAVASFAFAGIADGFWMALVLRFLSGAALAGVHMPGLKLLVDRVAGRAGARGTAIYISSYALGSAGSFFLTGVVDTAFGWRASFTASGIAPLLAIAALTLLPAASQPTPATAVALDFRPVLRDRALMAYVLAFAGNIWEVSAVRAWFVAYLAWTLSLPGNDLPLPALAVISGLASLAGFPVSDRRSGTDIALRQTGDRRDLPHFGAGMPGACRDGRRADPPCAAAAGAGADYQHRRCRRALQRRGRGGRSGAARHGARRLRLHRLHRGVCRPGCRRYRARPIRRRGRRHGMDCGIRHDGVGLDRCRLGDARRAH